MAARELIRRRASQAASIRDFTVTTGCAALRCSGSRRAQRRSFIDDAGSVGAALSRFLSSVNALNVVPRDLWRVGGGGNDRPSTPVNQPRDARAVAGWRRQADPRGTPPQAVIASLSSPYRRGGQS